MCYAHVFQDIDHIKIIHKHSLLIFILRFQGMEKRAKSIRTEILKNQFMHDIHALSVCWTDDVFTEALSLFILKWEASEDETVLPVLEHFRKVWTQQQCFIEG